MQHSLYRSVLRVSLLSTALVLVFDSGIVSPLTKHLSDGTVAYLAQSSAGVFAQVEPNELNTMTAELRIREEDLNRRESALRDIEARTYDAGTTDYSTYILSVVLFILTVLILMNYILDWRRVQLTRA